MQKYGSLDYHRLGRVYGRTELRLPWPEAHLRRVDSAPVILPYIAPATLIIATRTATGRDTSHTVTGRGTTRSGGRG